MIQTEGSDALWVNAADVGPIVSKQGLKRHSSRASDVWLITSLVTQSELEQSLRLGTDIQLPTECVCVCVYQEI